jgi:hypothetical protein
VTAGGDLEMLQKIDSEEIFLDPVCFSDGPIFYLKGIVNRHNCRIWGSQAPHEIIKHKRDKPKVTVRCGMMTDHTIRPLFLSGRNRDMLEYYTVPQLPCGAWFQQDRAPPQFGKIGRQFLNEHFPNNWI